MNEISAQEAIKLTTLKTDSKIKVNRKRDWIGEIFDHIRYYAEYNKYTHFTIFYYSHSPNRKEGQEIIDHLERLGYSAYWEWIEGNSYHLRISAVNQKANGSHQVSSRQDND